LHRRQQRSRRAWGAGAPRSAADTCRVSVGIRPRGACSALLD
jgi:hypothetical protein